jgi:hypothetical protein
MQNNARSPNNQKHVHLNNLTWDNHINYAIGKADKKL